MPKKDFKQSLTQLFLVIVTIVSIWLVFISSASATSIAFKTEGKVGKEGVLNGEVVFKQTAFQDALQERQQKGDSAEFIPLNEIKGSKLTFHYVSPYSGVVHSESSLCGKAVYDIAGFEEKPLLGAKQSMLVLANGVPDSLDFSSCVGDKEELASNISKRDTRVVSSTADSLGGKFSVFDKDGSGRMLFKQIKTITFTQKISD